MANADSGGARAYHEATKHSPHSVRMNAHFLDWGNQPALYKSYPDLDHLSLPTDLPQSGQPAWQVLNQPPSPPGRESMPTIRQIAYLLYFTAGITKKLVHPHGEIYFRAAACAGALYPIETYLVCGELPGLPAGVYHFSPQKFALHRLRQGDFRSLLAEASGGESQVRHAPAILVFTAITWRSSWKYQSRAYRYHFWDNGTMLANALAAASALGIPATVGMGFADPNVNRLVGVDGQDERALSLLPLGWTEELPPEAPDQAPALQLRLAPLSSHQVEYPWIERAHQASSLTDPARVSAWRAGRHSQVSPDRARRSDLLVLQPPGGAQWPQHSIEDIIRRRGSTRRFESGPISVDQLAALLEAVTRDIPADWRSPGEGLQNELYLNVHSVTGLPPGAYVYHPDEAALESLKQGNFRGEAAYLCLGQELGGASSFTVFYLADLNAILERYGDRGYRLVQTEAAILGGRLYLAAYALGLGATGLTFFDDLMVNFFEPHASAKDAIFVTACGVPARSHRRVGRLVWLAPGRAD